MKRTLLTLASLLVVACDSSAPAPATGDAPAMLADSVSVAKLEADVAKFAPARIDFEADALEPWEKQVIAKLVEASDLLHEIFSEQVSPQNAEWRTRLASATDSAGRAAARYFDIMVGPWDRLNHDRPFLAAGPKPPGAGYYPADMTKEEFEAWLEKHPGDREAFTGYFTVIRRQNDSLVAVPYSEAYGARLEPAAKLLREAAGLSRNASLADYLNKRADAFLSNDYYASDLAWMDIEGSRIEPTIGPYEVYEDNLFGYKAAFESFITVADSAASVELQSLKDHLPDLERSLPIEDRFKNPNRGFESPIRVVDEVYTAGDTRAGVQTTAFNLPNDVRVQEQKGSKKVMLRNVSQAKFDGILEPIAERLLAPDLVRRVVFRPWFINVVMHELAHGLGPTTVTLSSGERTTVNKALRDHYSALEEAKADVTGLHNLTILAGNGVFDRAFVEQAFAGHVADLFRAVRFGTGEAHGKANLIQFNWLREKNALRYDEATGRFSADIAALEAANRELAHEILTIQAHGSYEEDAKLVERYGTIRPELTAALEKLRDVPVDIRPDYTVRARLREWTAGD
jgi:hypothetical protein